MFCNCSLAGTAACKYCYNNPNAEPSPYRVYISPTTGLQLGISGYICHETGDICEHATINGFCQLTACRKRTCTGEPSPNGAAIGFTSKKQYLEDYINQATEEFKRQLLEIIKNIDK